MTTLLEKGNFYAGIGSRQTPADIMAFMTEIARYLERKGLILRSGGADGSDSAFEKGVQNPKYKEIYLPWKGFNDRISPFHSYLPKHEEIARRFHPAWERLSRGAKAMMIRNTAQMFGMDFTTPSAFVICWTPGGQITGGTGQALRIAIEYHIPIYNLFDKEVQDMFRQLIDEKTT